MMLILSWLLMLGAENNLKIFCCTPSVGWLKSTANGGLGVESKWLVGRRGVAGSQEEQAEKGAGKGKESERHRSCGFWHAASRPTPVIFFFLCFWTDDFVASCS